VNDFLEHRPAAVAILDAHQGTQTTYGELAEAVARTGDALRRELGRALVFHLATNTTDSIVLYLACLSTGCPLLLLEPASRERLEPLLDAYDPQAILLPAAECELPASVQRGPALPTRGYRLGIRRTRDAAPTLHPDLALLLTTSGSTGSPKLVRLTASNVLSNARSIASYLGIEPGERSIQGLPMHYSFGLSLVNSHLVAGATVTLTPHSFLRPEFWETFDRTQCTSFAGVPYMYETLHRLRFEPQRHPTLRTMTQAGGNLRRDLIQHFYERCRSASCRFFVMYGQTEASPRISYVPHDRLGAKIGSIGIPIPGGHLSLASVAGTEQQELIYRGPNVMLGYAESAADLAAGDELKGTLRTGDLASADGDGFFYLEGRLKRFAKLFGRRVNLEDVERALEARYPIHVVAQDHDGDLLIFAAAREEPVDLSVIGNYLAQQLGVPPKCIRLAAVDEIPMTASGKKDYRALQS
jgi:acyl-CoA synthetase (AMP-forming)/AMP-acid ligase II